MPSHWRFLSHAQREGLVSFQKRSVVSAALRARHPVGAVAYPFRECPLRGMSVPAHLETRPYEPPGAVVNTPSLSESSLIAVMLLHSCCNCRIFSCFCNVILIPYDRRALRTPFLALSFASVHHPPLSSSNTFPRSERLFLDPWSIRIFQRHKRRILGIKTAGTEP